jgi:hypothetical protein
MKKEFFKYAVFAMIVMFSLLACEKENENSATVIGKATITGSVKGRFDLVTSNADSLGNIPSTVKLYARYNSKALITNPSTIATATYADIIKEITLDGSGNYTITVDANVKDVTVTLYADDFTHTLTNGSDPVPTKTFTLAPVTVSVTKDVVRIQNLVFRAQ